MTPGDKGVTELARKLKGMRLENLNLSNSSIGDNGLMALAENLPMTLTTLKLSSNQIGSSGVIELAPKLPSILTNLNLSHNSISLV